MSEATEPTVWFFINNINPSATAGEIATLIAEKTGMAITPANITFKQIGPYKVNALVKIPAPELARILTWFLSESQLHGKPVVIDAPRQKRAA